jgi:hypothetical protein
MQMLAKSKQTLSCIDKTPAMLLIVKTCRIPVKVSFTSYFISLVIVFTLIFGGKFFCSLRHSIIFFISWKADILPTIILLDPILDDYLELMFYKFITF